MSDGGGGLLRTIVERPVTVIVCAVLVVLFGALSVVDIPIQLTPDITRPTLTVSTRWPGAAPTEIETEILEEQEDALKSLAGLSEMTSEARPDRARVTLEFAVGTDIDQALVRASNALSQVSDYPEAADEPSIETSDTSGPPLAVIAVRDRQGASVAAYRTWVAQNIVPEIERIPGVSDVRHIGGRDTEVHVDFDPAELAARRITVGELVSKVRAELRDVSGGDLTLGKRRILVRTLAAPADPELLEHSVIAAGADGTPIRLGDVAEVSIGLRKATGVAMSDDRPSMVMLLSREAGTNVLEVTEEVRRVVSELNEERFAPEGLEIEVLSDQTGYITAALELVERNLLIGAVLAVLVLLFFLRSAGASAIVSMSIPVCVLGTALGMTMMGRTVNVVSLAGVTFAVGMVLDNSIVSLESIDTWRTKLSDARDAALMGIRRVWGAILASTATTAAVFAPVIAWEGEVGQLLRDVAVAVSFAVVTSLLVSVLVIPSLAASFLKPKVATSSRIAALGERIRGRICAAATWCAAKSRRSATVVVGAVAVSVAVAAALLPPLEYLPTGNRNLIFGILIPPPGVAIEELEIVGERVQGEMTRHTGREVDGVPAVSRSFFVGSPNGVFAGAVAEDPDRVKELMGFMRGLQSRQPGIHSFTNQASLFGRAVGGGRSIEIDLSGRDLEDLSRVAGRMFGKVREAMPGAQVRPRPSLDSGAPELHAIPRRDEAAGLALTAGEVGLVVNAYADGAIVGELGPEGATQVDVVVRARSSSGRLLEDPAALASAPVATPSGDVVPLGVLARLEEGLGPTVIRRIERSRAITLQVNPPDELPLETAIEMIDRDVIGVLEADGALPPGVLVSLSGAASDLDIAKGDFAYVLLLALIISFLLMAALFEDFLAPVVVLVTVPLAAAGGVATLRLVDAVLGPQPLDLMTALGFLILIGVVVNNAILIVDGAMAELRGGADLERAVGEAVRSRVRPIFMTTATSIAGLAPMVLFSGSGSELYRGVGAVVLGGLALATALTLFVVPSLFSLVWRVRLRVRRID